MDKNSTEMLFRGVATALITPFQNAAVDTAVWRGLIETQLRAGVSALVVAGTTGEAPTLSDTERDILLEKAVAIAKGKAPIIMGCGSNDTAHAIYYAKQAEALGADAILVVTPYYNKGTREGIRTHFLCIADAIGIPLILYNVPSRTGVDLTLEDYELLTEHPNIRGIKEASGSIEKLAHLCKRMRGRAKVYTGNDAMLLPSLSLGADGVISVASNPFPRRVGRVFRRWCEGRTEAAREEAEALLPLIDLLFRETNPAPIKYAMSLLGFGDGEVRLPLASPEQELREALYREISLLAGEG